MTNGPQTNPWLWLHGFILATAPDRNSHIQNQRRNSSPVGIREKFLRLDRRRHILPTCNNAPPDCVPGRATGTAKPSSGHAAEARADKSACGDKSLAASGSASRWAGRSSPAAHGHLATARWIDRLCVTSCRGNTETGIACLIEDLRTWCQQSCRYQVLGRHRSGDASDAAVFVVPNSSRLHVCCEQTWR